MFVANFRPAFRSRKGFALVVTLVVVALLTIIVTAFLTSATNDRLVSRAYLNRVRAEQAAEAGLAKVLATFRSSQAPTSFSFATGSGPDKIPRLFSYDASGELNVAAGAPLQSSGSTSYKFVFSSDYERQAGYETLSDASGNEVGRYAYTTVDESGKLPLSVAGNPKPNYDRQSLKEMAELPVLQPDLQQAVAMNRATLSRFQELLPFAHSVLSANQMTSGTGSIFTPLVTEYDYTLASPNALVSPDRKSNGKPRPRVDISKLKRHIDSLASTQTKGNPKANLIERLLREDEEGGEWDGGNFSYLNKTAYSVQERRQILANLIDYLDEDVIPTTDQVPTTDAPNDYPTYMGVEGKVLGNGLTQTHPMLAYVGTGMVFNRSGATGQQGALNSSLVLAYFGFVNPTDNPTFDWSNYVWELEIEIGGQAGGGNLGGNAKDYFASTFTENMGTSPGVNIPARDSWIVPKDPGSAVSYVARKNFLPDRQPPGMSFSQLTYNVKKMRLKYNSSSGQSGYVYILENFPQLKNMAADPPSVSLGNGTTALIYRLGNGATGGAAKKDLHLNSDPRLWYKPESWILQTSVLDGTKSPKGNSVDVFAARRGDDSDFPAAPGPTDSTWYKSSNPSAVSRHFYVKSSPKYDPNLPEGSRFPEPSFKSIGEIGYLSVGRPWETLRLYVSASNLAPSSPKGLDRNLLDRIWSGTFVVGADLLRDPQGSVPSSGAIPVQSGLISINADRPLGLAAAFVGSTAGSDAEATARARGDMPDPDALKLAKAVVESRTKVAGSVGEVLESSEVRNWTSAQTEDYQKEGFIRRVANGLTVKSLRFTVYIQGEARDKIGTRIVTASSARMKVEFELRSGSNGEPVPVVLSKNFY